MTIKHNDITVVVQGALHDTYTPLTLKSIRKHLKGSTIILSTWHGANTSNLEGLYDKLILNKDPGVIKSCLANKYTNNVNRQIASTLAGIKYAKTKYILKFRTDIELTGNDFLNYFNKYNVFASDFRFVDSRVLIPSLYTRNPHFTYPGTHNLFLLYHPSDIAMFGTKKDILNIWNIPINGNENIASKYCPEQYICINFLNKFQQNIKFRELYDITFKNILNTNKIFANNFVILDMDQININFLKPNLNSHNPELCYTFSNWHNLYCLHSDKNLLNKKFT